MKKILFAAAECFPFSKAGGLADVVGTLPAELKKLGYDVRVIVPCHKVTRDKFTLEHKLNFNISLGWRCQYVGIEQLERDGVIYYFVDNEYYFGSTMYKGGVAEAEQYMFFSRAVLESLPLIDFIPDVMLANDWHTALIPMLIKTQYTDKPQSSIKTALAIHNLAYQGKLPFDVLKDMLKVDESLYTSEYLECCGCANALKAGLVFADKLITVSPTYAEEIMYDYFGEGLEGVLSSRRSDLVGILNGIDVVEFDPETDKRIAANYSANNIDGKFKCREALIRELGFEKRKEAPLISMVTRLTEQKGLDLVCGIFEQLLSEEDISFAVLGTGEKRYVDAFKHFESLFPDKVRALMFYDDDLAHRLYAGSDLFLMPSKFEPCGISQMIALRYGTLPIVRETGGLKDTVKAYNKYTGEGNGFSFKNYNAHDMMNVIKYAVTAIKDTSVRSSLILNAMNGCYSFKESAAKYAEVLESL
ncbi:MAG: glycogen synthase GlgA [Christensenellaceae bacterium]|nr:glycogen synthase GlgA [Christensenellaceae bacterium]